LNAIKRAIREAHADRYVRELQRRADENATLVMEWREQMRRQAQIEAQQSAIWAEQERQRREQERIAKEQAKQAEQIAKHERRIEQLEFKKYQAENALEYLKFRYTNLQELREPLVAQLERTSPDSKEFVALEKKLISVDNQLYVVCKQGRKARFDLEQAEKELSA